LNKNSLDKDVEQKDKKLVTLSKSRESRALYHSTKDFYLWDVSQ